MAAAHVGALRRHQPAAPAGGGDDYDDDDHLFPGGCRPVPLATFAERAAAGHAGVQLLRMTQDEPPLSPPTSRAGCYPLCRGQRGRTALPRELKTRSA